MENDSKMSTKITSDMVNNWKLKGTENLEDKEVIFMYAGIKLHGWYMSGDVWPADKI